MATKWQASRLRIGVGVVVVATVAYLFVSGNREGTSRDEKSSIARSQSLELLRAAEELYERGKAEEAIDQAGKAYKASVLDSATSVVVKQKLDAWRQARDSELARPLLEAARQAISSGHLDVAIGDLSEAAQYVHAQQLQEINNLAEKLKYTTSDEGLAKALATFTEDEFKLFFKEADLPKRQLTPDPDCETALRFSLAKAHGAAKSLRKLGLERLEQTKAADELLKMNQLMSRPIEQQASTVIATVVDKYAVLWEKADTNSKKVGTVPRGHSLPVESTVNVKVGPEGRQISQFFHSVNYKNRKGFIGAWLAELQVSFPESKTDFRVENLTSRLGGEGVVADFVLKGKESPSKSVLDLISKWAIQKKIDAATVYMESRTKDDHLPDNKEGREVVCRLESGRVIPKEDVLKEVADKELKDEKDLTKKNLLKAQFDRLTKELNSVQKKAGGSLISYVEVQSRYDISEAKFTVVDEWHTANYQMRLQSAQALAAIWANIVSPENPDHARISILDRMGNEVGGTGLLGIWVQKN